RTVLRETSFRVSPLSNEKEVNQTKLTDLGRRDALFTALGVDPFELDPSINGIGLLSTSLLDEDPGQCLTWHHAVFQQHICILIEIETTGLGQRVGEDQSAL